MAGMMLSWLAALLALGEGGPPPATPAPEPAVAPGAAPAAAADPVRPVAAAAPPVMGGFSPVNLRAAELRPVVKVAVAHLTPLANPRARLLSAEQQVVAGTNYRLLLQLRDGSRWRVTVWQRLDGTRQVTEAVRTPS